MDKDNLRKGYYSDQYFNNTVEILQTLSEEGYFFPDIDTDLNDIVDTEGCSIGDLVVEMQFFTRRKPYVIISGINEVLKMLSECVGYFNGGTFINTFDKLEVEVVSDGDKIFYDGEVQDVLPVLKIRGRYRDFAHLETPVLGILSYATRIATNVYDVLEAADGKRILFFPARFDHYLVQKTQGYAYKLALNTFIKERKEKGLSYPNPSVSTFAQSELWNGLPGGTTSHSTIASFLGNPGEMMVQFARIMPLEIPRVALVDFHNDCVKDTLLVLDMMFKEYSTLIKKQRYKEADKYRLNGVRPDTSGNMIDESIDKDEDNPYGVTPRLVNNLRQAIDDYAKTLKGTYNLDAEEYCQNVSITVTGGFNVDRIREFESLNVPVDAYGVGSSLLKNDEKTNADFTADIVRVKIKDTWYDLAKVGRKVCNNPLLKRYEGSVSNEKI